MIIDPGRDRTKVYHDDVLTYVKGSPEDCIDLIVQMTSQVFNCQSSKELYGGLILFEYKGTKYRQLILPCLDVLGIGMHFLNIFNEIGFKFKNLEIKKFDLTEAHKDFSIKSGKGY